MKNSILFLPIVLLVTSSFVKVSVEPISSEFLCNEIAHFTEPSQRKIATGEDMYVKVDFNDDRFVTSVKLFIGHRPVRIIRNAPYEWGMPNSTADPQLRNMPAGNYALGIEVIYACGNRRTFSKYMKVGSTKLVLEKYNPIYSLKWLKTIHLSQPNSKISEYRKGAQKLYKIEPCNRKIGTTNWYDPNGRLAGRFPVAQSQGQFAYAKLVKKWYTPCD